MAQADRPCARLTERHSSDSAAHVRRAIGLKPFRLLPIPTFVGSHPDYQDSPLAYGSQLDCGPLLPLFAELRTPLATILANLDFALDELSTTDLTDPADPTDLAAAAEALDDARSAAQRIWRQLANFLDTGRIELGAFELRRAPVELVGLLHALVDARRSIARAGEVELRAPTSAPIRVMLDIDVMTRVIENVIDNAIRYTPPKGRVAITAEVANDRVQLRIGNSGADIPVAERTTLFTRPFSIDGSQHSRNFGLYFCRLAVEAHGGRLWIDTNEIFPVVFVLELPT